MKIFGIEFKGPFEFEEPLLYSPGIILLGVHDKGEFSIKEVICDMNLHNKILELITLYNDKITFYFRYLPECSEVDLSQIAYFLRNHFLKNEQKAM